MSLTRDDLADIKQLMEAVVGAAMKEQDAKFEKRFEQIDQHFEQVEQRFNEAQELQNEILEAVSDESARQGAMLDDHETRITRLEKSVA